MGKTKDKAPPVERRFYLVHRLKHDTTFLKPREGARVTSNPFGGGRLGEYELDYMGSAEFEFGATTKAWNRLVAEQKHLTVNTLDYIGKTLAMLWIETEGDPREQWVKWAEGRVHPETLRCKKCRRNHSWRSHSAEVGNCRSFAADGSTCEGELEPYADPPFYGKQNPYELAEILKGRPEPEHGWAAQVWWSLDDNVMWSFVDEGSDDPENSHLVRMLHSIPKVGTEFLR